MCGDGKEAYREVPDKVTSPTTAKGKYKPRKRDWVICPVCKKRFSVSGAEHRSRIKRGFPEPCCSRRCSQEKKNGGK